MKIITVIGKRDTRKTTLITKVYNEILKNGVLHFYKVEGADEQDFKALVKWNNKKVAFCSIGDPSDPNHIPSEYILRGLVFASKNEADILINAYSDSFTSKNGFNEFPLEIYEAIVNIHNDTKLYIPIKIDDKKDLQVQFDGNFTKILNEISK